MAPLFFIVCGPNKKGHSSLEERKKLFEYFDAVFTYENIEHVVADREFMGGDWMRHLQSKNIKFMQRCKDKKLLMSNARGIMVHVRSFCHGILPGTQVYLGLRKISKTNMFLAHVTILRTPDDELVVLAHSQGIHDPCKAYRARWKLL